MVVLAQLRLDRGYALLIGFLVCLVTFNTNITHLGDALAALGNYRDAITCHVNGT